MQAIYGMKLLSMLMNAKAIQMLLRLELQTITAGSMVPSCLINGNRMNLQSIIIIKRCFSLFWMIWTNALPMKHGAPIYIR